MLAIEYRRIEHFDQLLQAVLAVKLRLASQVLSVMDVKGVEDHPVLTTFSQVRLQFREVGPIFVDDDDFTVEDGLAFQLERFGDAGEPVRPVVAAGEYLGGAVYVDLCAIAVVFDFVNPLST